MNLKNLTDEQLREEWKKWQKSDFTNPYKELESEIVSRFMNQELPTKPDLSEAWNKAERLYQACSKKPVNKWGQAIQIGRQLSLEDFTKEGYATLNDIQK